jgi:hypothetical protein
MILLKKGNFASKLNTTSLMVDKWFDVKELFPNLNITIEVINFMFIILFLIRVDFFIYGRQQ